MIWLYSTGTVYLPCTSRIQRLGFHPHQVSGFGQKNRPDVEIFRALSIFESLYLIPNLKEVCWMEDNPASFPCILLFLGPQLKTLYFHLIHGSHHTQVVDSVLDTLMHTFPLIENLDFNLWCLPFWQFFHALSVTCIVSGSLNVEQSLYSMM
jgi:hypothetical protein